MGHTQLSVLPTPPKSKVSAWAPSGVKKPDHMEVWSTEMDFVTKLKHKNRSSLQLLANVFTSHINPRPGGGLSHLRPGGGGGQDDHAT